MWSQTSSSESYSTPGTQPLDWAMRIKRSGSGESRVILQKRDWAISSKEVGIWIWVQGHALIRGQAMRIVGWVRLQGQTGEVYDGRPPRNYRGFLQYLDFSHGVQGQVWVILKYRYWAMRSVRSSLGTITMSTTWTEPLWEWGQAPEPSSCSCPCSPSPLRTMF